MNVSYESYWSASMMIDCSLNRGCNKYGFTASLSPMSPDKLLLLGLGPKEGQQISIHLILMRSRDAVRCTRIVDFLSALDESGRLPSRVLDRDDLVVFAVQDQSRDIDLLEVLGEISLREGLDALVRVLEAGLHAPEPELIQYTLGDLRPRPIGTVITIKNPLNVDARVIVQTVLPKFLVAKGWKSTLANPGGEAFTLKPAETKPVILKLAPGTEFTAEETKKAIASGDAAIHVIASANGIVVEQHVVRTDAVIPQSAAAGRSTHRKLSTSIRSRLGLRSVWVNRSRLRSGDSVMPTKTGRLVRKTVRLEWVEKS